MARQNRLLTALWSLCLMLGVWSGVTNRATAGENAAEPTPLDVLVLIDNSHSLDRFDPFHLRADLVKALHQFYAGSQDRFALAEFNQKQVDFQTYRSEDWDALVTNKLAHATAYTSDPSDAAAGPLAAAAARANPRPLWIVVVTDGDINVYNQSNTNRIYIDNAFKAYSRDQVLANPGLINEEAARQMSQPDNVKKFHAIQGIYTPVVFDQPGTFYTALAGAADRPTKPVVLNTAVLQDLFLGLIRSRPGSVPPSVFAYAKYTLDGGQKQTDKLQLPEGHQRSRVVFFGIGDTFTVRLLQNGEEKRSAGKTAGGDQFAVLNLENLPAGEYDLEIANAGRGRKLAAEYALFLSIDAAAEIAAAPRTAIGEMPFAIALRNREKKTLTDPGILKDLQATLTLQKASASGPPAATKTFDLSKERESAALAALPVALTLEPGDYTATVRFQTLKLKGGAYGVDLTATTTVKVTPVLEVIFTHDPKIKHFVNENAELSAQLRSSSPGQITPEQQTITLVSDRGGEAKVVLTKKTQGGYVGTFPADRAGAWTIQSEITPTLAIGAGGNPTFVATPFSLTPAATLGKQLYVQEAFQGVFVSEDFQKFNDKDPEATLALKLTPAASGAEPVTVQLNLDKAVYAKETRVKYDIAPGSRFAMPGRFALQPGFVGNTYTLTNPVEVEALDRQFTLAYKKADGSWQTVTPNEPAKITLKLPWNEQWPSAAADQKAWVSEKFNNQLQLKATVSLGQRGPGDPERATLAVVAIENKYSKVAQDAGADKADIFVFQALDAKNTIVGSESDPYTAPQTGEIIFSLQPSKAIKFDGPLCLYAAKLKIDDYELPVQPQFDVTIETPDKAWKQFMEMLPIILIVVVVVALIIWWVSIPRFKEHQVRPLRKGQPLNTVHMLVSMKVGMAGREAIATPEAPNCIKFRRVNATTTAVTSINEKVFIFVGNDKITGWRDLKHGDELVIDGAGVFQRYRYFERQPTEEELKAASASALDEDSDIIVEGL